MAFVTKTWKDRLVEFSGRRKLKNVSTNEETIYDVSRSEGTVMQAGDQFSAENMNNLEQRIKTEFDSVNSSLCEYLKLADLIYLETNEMTVSPNSTKYTIVTVPSGYELVSLFTNNTFINAACDTISDTEKKVTVRSLNSSSSITVKAFLLLKKI